MHSISYKFLFILCFFTINICNAQSDRKRIDSLINVSKLIVDPDSSYLILEKVIRDSKAINYKKGIINAVLVKGVSLFNNNKFEEALKLLNAYETLILSSDSDEKKSHLLALKGNCYGNLSFLEKSNQCLAEAKQYANKIKDNNTRYFNLGRIYRIVANNFKENRALRSRMDSMIHYKKKAYNLVSKITSNEINYKPGHIVSASSIGSSFLEVGKYDSAKHYFTQSIALAEKYKLQKYTVIALRGLGDINQKDNKLDSALMYYQKALKLSIATENAIDIKINYQKLSIIHDKLGNRELSFNYLKKYGAIADSLATANKKAVKVSADLMLKEQNISHQEKKKNYTAIIIGVVALLVVSIFTLLKLRKGHKKTIHVYQVQQTLLNEKLTFLKTTPTKDNVEEEELKNLIALAAANDPTFLIKFKALHPIFIQKLMEYAPSFVTSDLLICAQLRLGFYTKEIARYTKTSVRAVEGKKYRIRKKLTIEASEDLNVWMMNL